MKHPSKQDAFTLVETLLAVSFTTVVLTAITGLILSTLLVSEHDRYELQANLLAQESLEAIRYMRDSNWLQNYSWDGGGALWVQDFHVEGAMDSPTSEKTLYLKSELCREPHPCFSLSYAPEDGLFITEMGEFQRSLILRTVHDADGNPLPGQMEVTAHVTWDQRGTERVLELSTTLTDWK